MISLSLSLFMGGAKLLKIIFKASKVNCTHRVSNKIFFLQSAVVSFATLLLLLLLLLILLFMMLYM